MRRFFHRIVFWALLPILCIAACSQQPPTPTPAADWQEVDPTEWLTRAGLSSVFQLHNALSPDGKWLVNEIHVEPRAIQVFSTSDPALTLEIQTEETMGAYLTLGPWAPDGSAFVLYSAAQSASHCPFNKVLLFEIDERARTLDYTAFDPHCAGPSPFTSASWSPDGTRLAVSLNRYEIYVIDREASPQHAIRPELQEADKLFGLWWTGAGLFYHVGSADADSQHHELRMVDPDSPAAQRTLYESETSLAIVGWNPETERLLVREQDTGYPPAKTFDLLVLNPQTGDVEHTRTVEGSQCVEDAGPRSRYTALKIAEPGRGCALWFYNWDTHEMKRHGEIVALIGWRSNVQGFVVVKGSPQDRLWLETVIPTD
jgi:hypothetical protein